jgi:hypothetical protein
MARSGKNPEFLQAPLKWRETPVSSSATCSQKIQGRRKRPSVQICPFHPVSQETLQWLAVPLADFWLVHATPPRQSVPAWAVVALTEGR